MEAILRDPIWQGIGVLISVVALVVTIAAIRLQLLKKRLGYHHSVDRPVFYVFNPRLASRLQVTLDGNAVERLSTLDLHFFNHGNVPILPADFIEPIPIGFQPAVKVLGAVTSETSPPNLAVTLESAQGSYSVRPLLLNPGDEFGLRFLLDIPTDEIGMPKVQGRIAGVTLFRSEPYRPAWRYRAGYLANRLLPFLALALLGVTLVLMVAGAKFLYGIVSG